MAQLIKTKDELLKCQAVIKYTNTIAFSVDTIALLAEFLKVDEDILLEVFTVLNYRVNFGINEINPYPKKSFEEHLYDKVLKHEYLPEFLKYLGDLNGFNQVNRKTVEKLSDVPLKYPHLVKIPDEILNDTENKLCLDCGCEVVEVVRNAITYVECTVCHSMCTIVSHNSIWKTRKLNAKVSKANS